MNCANCKMPIMDDGHGDISHRNDQYACYPKARSNHIGYSLMATLPTTVVVETKDNK